MSVSSIVSLILDFFGLGIVVGMYLWVRELMREQRSNQIEQLRNDIRELKQLYRDSHEHEVTK